MTKYAISVLRISYTYYRYWYCWCSRFVSYHQGHHTHFSLQLVIGGTGILAKDLSHSASYACALLLNHQDSPCLTPLLLRCGLLQWQPSFDLQRWHSQGIPWAKWWQCINLILTCYTDMQYGQDRERNGKQVHVVANLCISDCSDHWTSMGELGLQVSKLL